MSLNDGGKITLRRRDAKMRWASKIGRKKKGIEKINMRKKNNDKENVEGG